MDDPHRRKGEYPSFLPTDPHSRDARQPSAQHVRHTNQSGHDRYRQSNVGSSSTPPSSATRGMSYNNYYPEPGHSFSMGIPAPSSGYSQGYGQDSQQHTPPQPFGGFATGPSMYSVAGQPAHAAPVFGAQTFGQRSLMTPQVASMYFNGEASSPSSHGIHSSSQAAPDQAGVYQSRSSNVGYQLEAQSQSAMQQASNDAEPAVTEDGMEEGWVNYQHQLGTVFRHISHGALEPAAETLMDITEWLLSQVMDLGLHLDDAALFQDRLRLWNGFNHAWLALGFKQREVLALEQPLSATQSLMSEPRIRTMIDGLIRLCDDIERHGLVDYEHGVWEEQIEGLYSECLDLLEQSDEGDGTD